MRLHAQQGDIDLNRRIAEQPQKLEFCFQLLRHDIQHEDPQRTDILMRSAVAVHDKDMLIEECLIGRQLR